jgi:hypothetical protein
VITFSIVIVDSLLLTASTRKRLVSGFAPRRDTQAGSLCPFPVPKLVETNLLISPFQELVNRVIGHQYREKGCPKEKAPLVSLCVLVSYQARKVPS